MRDKTGWVRAEAAGDPGPWRQQAILGHGRWEAGASRGIVREYDSTFTGEWTQGLLIRRNIAAGDLAFFSTWCPKRTPIQKLVLVEGRRWAI